MRRLTFQAVLYSVTIVTSYSYAAGEISPLEIRTELSHPGTRLVVVEFFATWCKPCMEAVPVWKDLHKRYGRQGLRLIVVSAEGDGHCTKAPDWTPDRSICDVDGSIQKRFGVRKLPQAFLWSWQGDLVAERAHAPQVAAAVERFFRETQYRMAIDPVDVRGDKYAISSNPEWVREHVSSRIIQRSKFDVVTSVDSAVRQSGTADCETAFPPNSVLKIILSGDGRGNRQLSLELGKDGCVRGKALRPYTGTGLDEDTESLKKAADLAVDDLFKSLMVVKEPSSPSMPVEEPPSAQMANIKPSKHDDPGAPAAPRAALSQSIGKYNRAALAEALSYLGNIRVNSMAYREDPMAGNGCYPPSLEKLGWKAATPPYYYGYSIVGDCLSCVIDATARQKDLAPQIVKIRCGDGFIDIGDGWNHPSELGERVRKMDLETGKAKGPSGP